MLTFHQYLELAEGTPKPSLGLPNHDRAATNPKSTTARLVTCLMHKIQKCGAYLTHMRDITYYVGTNGATRWIP